MRLPALHRKTALRNFNSTAHVEEPETEILLQPGVGGVASAVLPETEKMDVAVLRNDAILAGFERRQVEAFRCDRIVDAFRFRRGREIGDSDLPSYRLGKKTGHVLVDETVERRNIVGNAERVFAAPVFGYDQFLRT
jgi:hypothetical protein